MRPRVRRRRSPPRRPGSSRADRVARCERCRRRTRPGARRRAALRARDRALVHHRVPPITRSSAVDCGPTAHTATRAAARVVTRCRTVDVAGGVDRIATRSSADVDLHTNIRASAKRSSSRWLQRSLTATAESYPASRTASDNSRRVVPVRVGERADRRAETFAQPSPRGGDLGPQTRSSR